MKHFSETLKALIKENGLMQKDICKILSVSKNQVHYWIKDKAEPDLNTVVKIATYFNVSTDYLLGLEDEFGDKLTKIY